MMDTAGTMGTADTAARAERLCARYQVGERDFSDWQLADATLLDAS